MKEKLITFAVPCYNSQDYMQRCLRSLMAGGEEVEIIVIDDGAPRIGPVKSQIAMQKSIRKQSERYIRKTVVTEPE